MKNSKHRVLSFLLSILLLLSNISPAFAANDEILSKTGLTQNELTSLEEELKSFSTNQNNKSQPKNLNGKLRVVVELKKDPIANIADSMGKTVKELSASEIKTYEQGILAEQDSVKQKIQKADIKTYDTGDDNKKSDYSYTTVLNGFSTYIDSEDLDKLENLREVKNVYIVNEYNRPAEFPNMVSSGPQVGADSSWNLGYKGEGMVVSVLDSGYDIAHKDFVISDPSKVSLKQSDVDALIKINNLPGKYYTEKYPYAYNYYDNTDKIKSDTSNHGQHVAGTIAANGNIKGIAPEAQLLGMKVFSDDPLYATTFSDVYVKAIDDSVKLKADAINMSLGSPAGEYIYGSLEDVAIMNARDAGVLVAIAAGNEHSIIDGIDNFRNLLTSGVPLPYAKNVDTSVVGSPSLYKGDISVASVNNTHIQGRIFKYVTKEEEGKIQLSAASGAPSPWEVLTGTYTGANIVVINKENKGEGSNAPGDAKSFEGKDVRGKIVLVERGNLFTDTIKNAQENGAIAAIIYNNERKDDTLMNMAGGDIAKIPFFQIVRKDGLKIIDNLDDIKLTFPDEVEPFDHPKGGFISDFSSIGPTPELGIKPEISAPGGDIYSTDNDDSYVNMSGTSMATPHVAGAIALVGQRIKNDSALFGNLSKEERGRLAKILLLNTSKPIKNPNGEYYAVRQQGSGLMDVLGATTTDTYVVEKTSGEAKAEVGSFKDNKITIDLTIFNKSKQNRRFNLSANALTDQTAGANGYEYLLEETRPIKGIKVSGGGDIIVPKLGKKDVRVTIDLSEAIESGELKEQNFVEGFVFLDSKDQKVNLSVPYLGFYGNYEELNVLDEPITNLYDDDKSNDPMFTSTNLYYLEDGRITYPVASHTPVYFNPSIKGYGNSGLILRTTPLRNYDRIEYSIEDKDGNVLENLGQTSGGRKITNMGRQTNPFRLFEEGKWDGTIAGKPLEKDQTVYYTAKAFYLPTSKPQTIRFEVKADDSFPVVKDINGDFKSRKTKENASDPYYSDLKGADLRLAYDKESRQITFEAYDTISGVDTVLIGNPATLKTDKPQVKGWQGKEELDTIREVVDESKGLYKYTITLPEEGYENNIINVQLIDKANNLITGAVIREDVESSPLESSDLIYSFNENTRILRLNVKKGSDAYLIPYKGDSSNPSLDFANFESFSDDDNDGIIDARLAKKYKANEVFLLLNNGNHIKYVLPLAEDKTQPLAPILNPAREDSIKEISGIAYEARMTITAYQNGEVIGEAKSDDDGLFKVELAKEAKLDSDITVKATREGSDLTSDEAVLAKSDLKAPKLDNDEITPALTELRGDAYLPFAEVVFEKEVDGKREEFARTASGTKGRFILENVDFSKLGLGLGDKIYIYSLKDGESSPEAPYTLTEGEGYKQPSDKLTMYINSPQLIVGYNGKVPFNITMFGWDNLDRVTFNGAELPFTTNNYQKVTSPKTGEQVHYGKTFTVKTSLDLEEGYYDIPIVAYDDKNERDFGLTRRFWVDKTKPQVDLITSEVSEDTTDENGSRTITITTSDNEVALNFLVNDNGPEISLKRGSTQIYTSGVTDASGFAFKETKASVNDVVKLGNEKEVIHEYTAYDIADNATKIRVKIVKEEANEEAKDNAPVITASDRTAYVGESLNLLYQVSAKDYRGNDLTEKVTSNPKSIDTSKPGEYKVKYEVVDEDGNYGTKTVTVKVIARKDANIDTSELVAKIDEAKKYQADNYSLTSFQRLQESIAKADYELKSVSLTDKIVESLIADIDNAIGDLVDISELKNAYEIANDEIQYCEEDYTSSSFKELQRRTEEARLVLAEENPSQVDVDLATRRLNEALKSLVRLGDKEELTKLYNKLEEILQNDADKYTEESLKALEEALSRAKEVLDNKEASQAEVDEVYAILIEAHKNLEEKVEVPQVNKEKLSLLYEQANQIDQSELTPKSAQRLVEALEKAYQVLTDESASQDQVDEAYEVLEKALNERKIKANKESLNALLEKYADLDKDQYTEESYKVFEEVLERAKAIAEDAEVSQEEVDKVVADLIDANDKLEKKRDFRKELEELVAKAEVEVKKSGYSRQSVMRLKLRISSAKRALKNESATDQELSKQIEELSLALTNLK